MWGKESRLTTRLEIESIQAISLVKFAKIAVSKLLFVYIIESWKNLPGSNSQ